MDSQLDFLLTKIRNITTPWEWRNFPALFKTQLESLSVEKLNTVMEEYYKKKTVLRQEKLRAENVWKVGVYNSYQAYSDDKRITQIARSTFDAIWSYQKEADSKNQSLYQTLMDNLSKYNFFVELFPKRHVPLKGKQKRLAVPVRDVVDELKEEKEIEVNVPDLQEFEYREFLNRINELEYLLISIRNMLEKALNEGSLLSNEKLKSVIDQLNEIDQKISEIKYDLDKE